MRDTAFKARGSSSLPSRLKFRRPTQPLAFFRYMPKGHPALEFAKVKLRRCPCKDVAKLSVIPTFNVCCRRWVWLIAADANWAGPKMPPSLHGKTF
ncbi:unnamed protein product [Protopolystoma xenopodis]|uniref:Uncharacterized protein n=1 Tax=Protopolystoma xenopodis TaxID=117903 RepID=A0A3S5BMK2_9PLAT|nr:unnamed protein product [Protopolystoma xenopodis]